MAKQYNVNIIGSLTNDNGVLSGFSAGNYATLSKTFDYSTQIALEMIFKFNSNNVSDEQAIFQIGDVFTANGYIDIEVYNSKLYFEFASQNTQRCYIEGVTTLSSNTDYWAKLTYNGTDTYTLSLSTDSTTWNTEGTVNSWYYLTNAQNSYIGTNQDLSQWYFNGSIDLNESYIKVNGAMWWRGAENITKIQLRHDTAANWTSVNPILLEGEVGLELDTGKSKVGDGSTAWNSLPYDAGSTALQSITSSNVTNALGYTPVNKAGDTMTGALTITNKLTINGGTTQQEIKNNTNYSTKTTAGEVYSDLQFQNYAGSRFNTIRSAITYDNTGTANGSYMIIGSNKLNSSAPDGIKIICDSNNNLSCTFPRTTCCDGQWVTSLVQVASTSGTITGTQYSLSSYLPNDGYNYMVTFMLFGYDNDSTYAYHINTDLADFGTSTTTDGRESYNQVCGGTSGRQSINTFDLPVGTGRYVKLYGSGADEIYVNVIGYRRIGTNA